MNIRFAVSLLLLGFCIISGGADNKQSKKDAVAAENRPEKIVKSKANEAAQAMVKGEYDRLADLTYPKVIEQMGGREKMISVAKAGLEELKTKGFEFCSAMVGDPSPLVDGRTEVYTIVPFTLEMKVPGGRANMKSFLVGISADKGKTWTFVDGFGINNDEKRKKILPNLPAELKLPKQEKPVVHKDE